MKNVVLVFVDNNEATLGLLREYFSSFKINLKKLYFNSPQDFIVWLKKRKGNQSLITVIDYSMPVITGVDLFKEVQKKIDIRILITGITESREISEAIQKGTVHYYVNKNSANFFEEIENIIDRSLYSLFGCKKIPK